MIHQVYGLKLAFLAIVEAVCHPVHAWNVAKEYLVETCPPELDSGYTDQMLTPEDFDAMTDYRPMARTLAEAFPHDRRTGAVESAAYPPISPRDWIPMVVGMACAFVAIGIVLSEMLQRAAR